MADTRLRGNAALWQYIRAAAAGSAFPSCIVYGPTGSGKKTAAYLAAQALVCTTADAPCGHCVPCKKVEKDIHPDVTAAEPDKKSGYSIDYVRTLRQAAYIQPNEAEHKALIFKEADLLLPITQNALLKLLEEPPSYLYVILCCENPETLLETVRSRCLLLATEPLSEAALREALAARPGAEQAAVQAAIRAANGSLGTAIRLLAGASEYDTYAEAIGAAIRRADEAALYTALLALERMKRDEIQQVLSRVIDGVGAVLFGDTGGESITRLSPQRRFRLYTVLRRIYDDTALYLTPGNLLAAAAADMYSVLCEPVRKQG